jgi:hypothetical protein
LAKEVRQYICLWKKKGFTNTVELLIDMMESIYHMGKVVTDDSSFCVGLGIMALHQHGIHGQFLIKEHCYWPKHVPGDYINT